MRGRDLLNVALTRCRVQCFRRRSAFARGHHRRPSSRHGASLPSTRSSRAGRAALSSRCSSLLGDPTLARKASSGSCFAACESRASGEQIRGRRQEEVADRLERFRPPRSRFRARVVARRALSPLRPGARVRLIGGEIFRANDARLIISPDRDGNGNYRGRQGLYMCARHASGGGVPGRDHAAGNFCATRDG